MPETLRDKVQRLILDRGYDSDPLRFRLQERGIDMICPHRRNRKKAKTQDGRKLRRYKRRWKVERTFAWFGRCRRLARDFEGSTATEVAWLLVAHLRLLTRRLAKP